MGKPKNVQNLHAKGVRSKRSVGAYGSKRGTPDKQLARTRARYSQQRVSGSMKEARAEQEALDQRIAEESRTPVQGMTPGALYARQQAEAERQAELDAIEAERLEELRLEELRERVRQSGGRQFAPLDGNGRDGWTIGQARKMVTLGYGVQHVINMTGVGYRWLDDLPVDSDGRGLSPDYDREVQSWHAPQ